MKIDSSLFSFVTYQDPHKAFQHLKENCFNPDEVCTAAVRENCNAFDVKDKNVETYDIDYAAFYGDLTSPERFKKIQVIVIDRHIPAMDGLELCRAIREESRLPVKIILLTGATTNDEALEAFKLGHIDAFIKKSSSSRMIEELNQALRNLSWKQFEKAGEHIAGLLAHRFPHTMDVEFCNAFNKARNIAGIVEFYLFDSSGSFLMLDKLGRAKLFLVRSTEDFKAIIDLLENTDASAQVLEKVHTNSAYPFDPYDRNYVSLEGDAWDDCMVDMQKITNRDLFYGIMELPDLKAYGFERFMNAL